MLKLILLLSTLLILSQAVIVNFQTSVVAVGPNSAYASRTISTGLISNPLVIGGYFKSVSRAVVNSTGVADGIIAVAYQYVGIAPTYFFSHFLSSANIQVTNNGYDLDVSTAANLLGVRYHIIQEVNPSGTVVRTEYLALFSWAITAQSNAGSAVPYLTMTGTRTGSGLVVEFTFLVPQDLNSVTLTDIKLGTYVPPAGVESLIGIDATAYQYQSTSNNLQLVAYVLTGVAAVQTNVQANVGATGVNVPNHGFVTSGTGSNAIGFRAAVAAAVKTGNGAYVNGAVTVSIAGMSNFSVINGANDIVAQVQKKYGATATITQVSLGFPAGATLIQYDPTSVSGCDPLVNGLSASATTSGVVSVTFSVSILFFIIFISFFFILI